MSVQPAFLTFLSTPPSVVPQAVQHLDTQIVLWLAAVRAAAPVLALVAVWITIAGSAPVTAGLTIVVAAFLALRGERGRAVLLAAVVLGGRAAIEVIKLLVDRPRPAFDIHPVAVHSSSFPSGHAGNSMICFLTFALLFAPARWRGLAVALAILASLVVGSTRPLLGVHWPSDVVAGWLFGILWVTGWFTLPGVRRLRPA